MDHRAVVPLAFALALALAAAGAVAAAAPVGATIASVHRAPATAVGFDLAGLPVSYPRLNAAAWILLGLALIGASAIAVAVRALLRQRRAYRRFVARLEIVGHLRGRPGVQVIADPSPQAFCAGYLRPRVYVSVGTLNLLTSEQLEAVLAHEHHHRRLRDPLRFASGQVLSQGLFFVPALRALFGRYAEEAELHADGAAVTGAGGGRAALASALLAFDASGAGVSPQRVDSLLGKPVVWRPPWGLVGASLGSLASLVALTWHTSETASAKATFNLPLVSGQPCLALLIVLALLGPAAVAGRRARARATRP